MQRTKSSGRSKYEQYLRGIVGLQQYEDENQGLRHWGRRETEDPFHSAREAPSFPLLGHGQLLWLFRKSSDVSSDSFAVVEVGSGTQLALQDEMGGVAKFTNGALDDNHQYYMSIAECMQIGAAGVITFRTRVRIADVDQCDMFVGFCERLGSGNIFDNRVNSVGFYLVDGSAGLCLETNNGGDARLITNQATLANDIWVTLEFSVQCTPGSNRQAVNFFADGVYLDTSVAKIPTEAMAFAFGIRNGEASANALSITTTVLLKD